MQRGRTRAEVIDPSISQQSCFDELIVKLVTQTMIPLSVVDHQVFKDVLDFLRMKVKRLKLMSRQTLGRRIELHYKKHVQWLRDVLSRTAWVATTADVWSSRTRSFMGMTVHWIDENFVRRSAALACRRFRGNTAFDKIAKLVEDLHDCYHLSSPKIVATVTDNNGANFVKAFAKFGVDADNIRVNDNRQETPAAESEDGADREVELEDDAQDDEVAGPSEEVEFGDNTEQGEESDDDDLEVYDELEDHSWVSVGAAAALLPSHIRCASHTLFLCATTDVNDVLEARPSLKAVHREVMDRCNALWSR